MGRHQMNVEIGFKHCDPAGIVFYPRYAEMVNDVVEHWFKHGLGVDFDRLHRVRRIAIPTVKLNCEFRAPSRLSETLIASLKVVAAGRSSLALRVDFEGQDGQARVEAEVKLVFVDIETMKPMEIPPDLRQSMQAYSAC